MDVINRHVLVLNKNWIPVAVTTVQSALVKVFSGGAKILNDDYQLFNADEWMEFGVAAGAQAIHTPTRSIRIPEVIMLLKYKEVPNRSMTFSRYKVFKRDRYTCQYCGKQPGVKDLTIDHVVPRAAGGRTNWENCVASCEECNRKKADTHPAPKGMRLSKKPIKPHWSFHLITHNHKQPESWKPFMSESRQGS